MESIRELFKIGYGPSSSHTMGPRKAADLFKTKNPNAARYRVTLYGSLAATGRGHLTDVAILDSLSKERTEIKWEKDIVLPEHPNGMLFEAIDTNGHSVNAWKVFSVGGGSISDNPGKAESKVLYKLNTMADILSWSNRHGAPLWEYVVENEGEDIWNYLKEVWIAMKEAIERGIEAEGTLPGILHLPRKACSVYIKSNAFEGHLKRKGLLYAYALAVSEENASGGKVVTAPTCGSCGVMPSVLYLLHNFNGCSETRILRALATAGLIGNLVKKNASISGADVGCQGEIGTACSMAAAAATQLFGGTPHEVEYAAEMGIEHHLGMTCDPIAGLVQIPCIERNCFAAARALDCSTYAILSDGRHKISFDKVVETMKRTGHDIPKIYKETSEGGLALI